MGLQQQITSGAIFSRQTVSIPRFNTEIDSGSVNSTVLAGNYILLSMGANKPCRVRLYQDSASVIIDRNRASSSFSLDDRVGLNVDAVLTEDNTSIRFDPPIMSTTYGDGVTWYNIDSTAGGTNIAFTVYNIGKIGDSTADRLTVTFSSSGSIANNASYSGNVSTKKSFVLLSGSASHVCRLRLYSVAVASVPGSETSRAYGTTPGDDSKLIADFMFDTGSFSYKFSPVLEGYTWSGTAYTTGTGTVGYILENKSGGSATITVPLHILSLED